MKKIFSAILVIIVFSFLFFLIHTYFDWFVDPLEENNNSNILFVLHFLGNLLLSLVYISFMGAFGLLGILLIYFSYCLVKLDFDAIKELKDLGFPTIIILGSITLLSIGGVQLRSLKIDNEPTNVRVVDPSFVRVLESNGIPKYLEDHFFYYNDSIKDWVLTSKIDYVKKKQKLSHLLYSVKSETKKYRKSTLGNWLEVNNMGFNAAKSAGLQTLEYIPKPCVNYFLFTSNDWKKITKDEFFKYRDLDSIVRYE
jgi:hypothetical protein